MLQKDSLSGQKQESIVNKLMNYQTPKTTIYDHRYKSKENYWDFKPSGMALKFLELFPPVKRSPRVLEIGCGEGGTAVFLARNGYDVTAFDLAETGVRKTLENAEKFQTSVKAFVADVNEYLPTEEYDIIFSSGTIQYLFPDRRKIFIEACQQKTAPKGLNVLHTLFQNLLLPLRQMPNTTNICGHLVNCF